MGIFDRFSRLVRAELNHRIGRRAPVGRPDVQPARPRGPERTSPAAPSLPAELVEAFRALGLEPGVSRAAARRAYLKGLKAHHPDRHQDDPAARARATDQSAKMNQAWDLLERYYDAQSNSTT